MTYKSVHLSPSFLSLFFFSLLFLPFPSLSSLLFLSCWVVLRQQKGTRVTKSNLLLCKATVFVAFAAVLPSPPSRSQVVSKQGTPSSQATDASCRCLLVLYAKDHVYTETALVARICLTCLLWVRLSKNTSRRQLWSVFFFSSSSIIKTTSHSITFHLSCILLISLPVFARKEMMHGRRIYVN